MRGCYGCPKKNTAITADCKSQRSGIVVTKSFTRRIGCAHGIRAVLSTRECARKIENSIGRLTTAFDFGHLCRNAKSTTVGTIDHSLETRSNRASRQPPGLFVVQARRQSVYRVSRPMPARSLGFISCHSGNTRLIGATQRHLPYTSANIRVRRWFPRTHGSAGGQVACPTRTAPYLAFM